MSLADGENPGAPSGGPAPAPGRRRPAAAGTGAPGAQAGIGGAEASGAPGPSAGIGGAEVSGGPGPQDGIGGAEASGAPGPQDGIGGAEASGAPGPQDGIGGAEASGAPGPSAGIGGAEVSGGPGPQDGIGGAEASGAPGPQDGIGGAEASGVRGPQDAPGGAEASGGPGPQAASCGVPERGARSDGAPARDARSDGAPEGGPRPDREPCGEGAARRGRPRSEAVERAIFDAVIGLLEGGVPLGDVSIERIARTAGVGKATIYRRWAGKEDLLVELIRSVEPPDPELPGVSVRDDLVMMLEFMRRRGLAKRSSALLRNMFTQMQAYPRLWDQYHRTAIEPRRSRGIEVLRRGVATGEVRADLDLDLVNDLFIGPLLLRTVLQPDADLAPDFPARVADAILDGVRPRD